MFAYIRFNINIGPYERATPRRDIVDAQLITADRDFLNNAEAIVTENNITRVGIHTNVAIGTYPILNRFWDERFEVAYINPIYHKSGSDGFTPQAVFDIRPVDDMSAIEWNGTTYIPVVSAPTYLFGLQYVLLLDEALIN
jgi:hypothetical protein